MGAWVAPQGLAHPGEFPGAGTSGLAGAAGGKSAALGRGMAGPGMRAAAAAEDRGDQVSLLAGHVCPKPLCTA